MAELTAGEALLIIRGSQEQLRADMAAATKLVTGELQKIEKSAGSINLASMVTGLNQGLQLAQQAVRATVATFDLLIGKSVEVGDEINRVSQAFDYSAEGLSGIKQAAGDVDVSFSEVQVSLKAFSNLLSDAASKGGDAAVKVAALGIDLGKLKDGTLSTEDAFRLAIDSLAGMEDGFQKTALQADAFGKTGSKFAVAFRDGSKSLDEATQAALAMGTGFDKVATESAAKLDDQLDELRNRTSGLSLTIGKELTPAATEAVGALNEWLAANQGVIREAIDGTIQNTAAAFRAARDAVDLANVKITTFLDLIRSVTGQAPAMGEALEMALRMAGFGQIVDGAHEAAAAVRSFGVEQAAAAEAAVKAAQQLDQLAKEIVAAGGATAEQKALYDEGRQALAALTAQYPAAARAVEAYRAKAAEAASTSTDLTKILQSMKGASSASAEGITNLARASNVSVDELRKLDETGKASDDTLRKIAGAMGITVDQVRALVGALKPAPSSLSGTADAAKKAAEANAKLADALTKLKLDELADDLDAATKALKDNATIAKDATYLRALEDIQAAYDAQVEAAKRATEEAVKAGADRAKAAEVEAAAVEQAQRDMGQAVKGLDEILVKNTEHWDDLGKWILDLPDEVRALIPTLDGIAAATGNVDEATFGFTEDVKEVKPAVDMATGAISDLSKAVVGLIDGTSSASNVLTTFLGGLTDTLAGGIGKALASSDFGKSVTSSLQGVFGDALGSAIATAGISSAVQIGAGIFISGVTDAMKGEAESAAAKIGFVVGGPIGSAIGLGIVEAFGIGHQSMIEKIASQLSEVFKASFESEAVTSAINDGLQEVGLFLGAGLELEMIRAPKDMGAQVTAAWKKLGTDSSYQFSSGFYQDMKEKGTQLIHSSIADVLNVFFPQITHDVAVGIQQSAVAAGSAMAAELGLVGDKAIKFANQWAIAFIGMMQQEGKGADEILKALHRIDTSLGTSQELVASFQRLQAVLMESGADMDALFAQINKQLSRITGKKVKVGNLDEVLAAVGGDATRALGVVENAMEMAEIPLERFTNQLSDVVLAISGDAGTAIRDASKDMQDFGNYSDGTAQILEQKVVTALGNVVKTAEELGYSAESVEALGTAASLISPELLKSDAVVQALHDSFAQMAVGAHMSIRELVDSIDPPIPAAVRQAILSVDDLGRSIGALSGAPLSSLKEVTDRMKQFAGDMYREVKDSEGKVTKELTAFGEQLVKDAVSAIGGMWDTITADGVIDPSDVQAVFEQIGQIPEEVLGDPAVQSSIQSLLAMIGAQTGNAFIIGLSALPEVTKEQLDEALKLYEQYKTDVEDDPPTITPEVTDPVPADGSSGDTPSGPDTSAATAAPPPAPVPPETVDSWKAITEAAKAYALAVVEGRDATTALSSEVVARAAEMIAAIKPIYGTPDDETSLSAIKQSLLDLDTLLLGDAAQAWKDWGAEASASISGVFTKAGELLSLVNAFPTDKTITFHLVTEGSIPSGGTVTPTPTPPTSHSGELIPGAPGTETLRLLEAGELVLPADLSARLLSGAVITSADVARIASAPVPTYASSRGASSASQAAPALPIASGWTFVPIREEALIDRALVRLERDTRDGRGTIANGRFTAHPLTHARARRG